jgi:UDP-glucose 4-epimerase
VTRGADTDLLGQGVTPVRADLLRPLDRESLPAIIDVVVHLAQHNAQFPLAARELFAVNTTRTQELLDYAIRHGARQFVFASSGDVYGYRETLQPFKETDPSAPNSFYGVTKHCSEMLARQYGEFLDVAILRLFTPYGPGQTGRLVPSVGTRVHDRLPVKVHLGGRPFLTPIYIEDVVSAFEVAIETDTSGTFNVAGRAVTNVKGIAQTIGRLIGKAPVCEDTTEDVSNLIGDNTLMQQTLGIAPVVCLEEGLERTIAALRR